MRVTGHIEKRDERGQKWRVVINAGKDAEGRYIRHTTNVNGSKRDAQKVLTEKLAKAQAGVYVGPSALTVAAWLRQWLDGSARMRVSPKSHQEYCGWIEGRIIPSLGHHKLDALTATAIQSAWFELLTQGRRDGRPGDGLSPKSVHNCHAILRAALGAAVRHGLIARNPCDIADLPRLRKPDLHVLDAAQIMTLLEAARGTTLFVPILLAATTGMRRGEVLALQWSDVDLDAGVLAVARSLEQTKSGLRIKEPKNGKPRKVRMPSLLLAELRRHREETGCVTGFVVCNRDGSPRSPTAVTQQFGRFVRTLDLPPVRFHDLRHSAASLLLRLGVELPVVSEVLGHSAVSTTANVYSHVLQAGREEAASRLDNALRKVQGE